MSVSSQVKLVLTALFISFLMYSPNASSSTPSDMQLFTKGKDVTIDPDKAYILIRTIEVSKRFPGAPILIRRLDELEKTNYQMAKLSAFEAAKPKADLERSKALTLRDAALAKGRDYKKSIPAELVYEDFTFDYKKTQNVYFFNPRKTYTNDDGETVYLAEVKPGTYVFYAQAYGALPGACFCMGSVEFQSKAGEITDVGYFSSGVIDPVRSPISIPEINEAARDIDEYKASTFIIETLIEPYSENMSIPDSLKDLPRNSAQLRAVGKMPNFMSMTILRLLPIPGILDYDADTIIDVKTGNRL